MDQPSIAPFRERGSATDIWNNPTYPVKSLVQSLQDESLPDAPLLLDQHAAGFQHSLLNAPETEFARDESHLSCDTSSNCRDIEWGFIMNHTPSQTQIAGSEKSGSQKSGVQRSKSRINTTDSEFRMTLRRNQVLTPAESPAPANIDEIIRFLERDRESEPPDQEDFCDYKAAMQAPNEDTLRTESIELIIKRPARGLHYRKVINHAFTETSTERGYNNNLSSPQPDVAFGYRWDEFTPAVIDTWPPGLVPSNDPHTIALPHFFAEYNSPGTDYVLAEAKAAYDGAYGVFVRREAQRLIGVRDPPRHAHVFSFASDGNLHRIFAHYREGERYYQHAIFAEFMSESATGYEKSYKRTRNLQDLAFQNATELKTLINGCHNGQTSRLPEPSSNNAAPLLTMTSSVEPGRVTNLVDDPPAQPVIDQYPSPQSA